MSILDSLLGNTSADASNAAAADTYAKQRQAIQGIQGAGNQYNTGMQGVSQAYNPYVQAGGGALQQLMGGLGLGGAEGSARFTNAYHALPGYQSGLETGTNAALSGINASGMSNSGRALKELQRFGSNYEDQRSGDYLSRLMGLSGMGQQAVGAQAGLQSQGLSGRLGAEQSAFGGALQAAPTIGQGQVAGAQAQQGALTNLMGMGAYLGGAALGGGFKIPKFA